MFLLDIAPWPDERVHRRIYDTIDTIAAPVNQFADPATSSGNGTATVLWSILTALATLVICLLMVRMYRRRQAPAGV